MKERNLCVEVACPAACCRSSSKRGQVNMVVGIDEINVFPSDIDFEVASPLFKTIEPEFIVRFKNCPNLDENNECDRYEDRPSACQNLGFGSPECDQARVRVGLFPVCAISKNP